MDELLDSGQQLIVVVYIGLLLAHQLQLLSGRLPEIGNQYDLKYFVQQLIPQTHVTQQ